MKVPRTSTKGGRPPTLSDPTARTFHDVLSRRRELADADNLRAVIDSARVRADLARRAGDPDRLHQALVDESAAALAEAERHARSARFHQDTDE